MEKIRDYLVGTRLASSTATCGSGGKRLRCALPQELIGPVEDQMRIYPLDERAARGVVVLGGRVIKKRQDFWIVS